MSRRHARNHPPVAVVSLGDGGCAQAWARVSAPGAIFPNRIQEAA